MTDQQVQRVLQRIEAERLRRGLSVRRAAARTPRISEGYWRQLVNGGMKQSGVWVPRVATTQQLLWMATAVGLGREIAEELGVKPPEDGSVSVDRRKLQEFREVLSDALRRLDELERDSDEESA